MYSFWLGIANDLRWIPLRLRSMLSFLPSQLTPSPEYPGLQVHVKERLVLVQYASSWQLCRPVLHSSTNQQVEISYKNSIDLNVFSCKAKKTDFMISWLKFIEKTLVSILQTKRVASLLLYRVASLRGCFASEFEFSISRALGLPPLARDNFSCHEQYCFFFVYANV